MIYDNPELIARQRQQKAIQKLMQRKPSIPDSQRVRQEPQVEITPTKVSRRLEREKHKFTGFKKSEPSKSKGKIIKSISKGVKSISSGTYNSRLSSSLLKSFSGQRQTSTGNQPQRGVGRPRGVFRHISPITGQPIPATVYYKELRTVRRHQSNLATQRQLAIQQNMARRGITPQQAQQMQFQARQMPIQQQIPPPMPQNQQIPQAGQVMPPQRRSIWNRQGYVAEEPDIMGNMKQKVYGRPESFFN